MNKLDLLLDKNLIIKENLLKLKEIYVEFYGEQYREQIEKSFSNLTIISYMMPKAIKRNFFEISKTVSKEQQINFLNTIGVFPNEENIDLYFGNTTFEYLNLIPIGKVYNLINKNNETKLNSHEIDQLYEMLSKILKVKVDDNNYETVKNNVLKFKLVYDEIIFKYNEKMSRYRDLQKDMEKYENEVIKLEKEYTIIFFELLEKYLSEKDIKYNEKMKKEPEDFSVSDMECNKTFCGYKFYSQGLIDFFDKESEKILNDKLNYSWRVKEIENSRIKYFQMKGLDLGDNYQDYIKYENIKDYYPSSQLVLEVSNIKMELKKRLGKKQFELTPVYKEYFSYLEGLELKNFREDFENLLFYTDEVGFKIFDAITSGTYISPDITKESKLHNLLVFDLNMSENYLDQIFLHELNHIVESNLLYADSEHYIVKTGFDYLDVNLDSEIQSDETRREYEYLSEYINETLMQELHEKMNKSGIYIFNNPDDTKIKGGTSYEYVKYLLKDFYDFYKEDIKESRLSNDMTKLFDKIGKENLIALNNLVGTFFENFSGFAYLTLIENLKENKETEKTILYKNLIKESQIILNNMKNYQVNSIQNIK